MIYKVGDKVVLKDGSKFYNTDYSNQIATIIGIRKWERLPDDYNIDLDERWCVDDDMIDHEATAKLNEVKPRQLLKTGMVVEYENGHKALVIIGELRSELYGDQSMMFVSNDGFMNGTSYDELLKSSYGIYNIDKIYKPIIHGLGGTFNNCNDSNLIWQRPIPQPEPKVIKMTSQQLLSKLGLDGNTKIEIEG